MNTKFTTQSGSHYLISNGCLYRLDQSGEASLGGTIIANNPISVGEGVYFILQNDSGEVYRVRTTPVIYVESDN